MLAVLPIYGDDADGADDGTVLSDGGDYDNNNGINDYGEANDGRCVR